VAWLQRRRRNWELTTEYVARDDQTVTLQLLEAGYAKVSDASADTKSEWQLSGRPPAARSLLRVALPPLRSPICLRAAAAPTRAAAHVLGYR